MQRIEDEIKQDQLKAESVGFLETGEDAAKALQLAEQPLDFSPPRWYTLAGMLKKWVMLACPE